ncbi:RNA polymerase sigma factor [Lacticaseibacillus paracasei]|uniref:Sigma factor-like helix-turn-helix DNA-binding protein n=1 Tax=Lacticaseibacillus paracasei TaxID=1597 RepID=A0AAW6A801_LACPA|nr:sigma factor-like helix-turn-helix DNA-binding protein [Lacticaseibacillus paracasei]MDB1565606.1 sigma factor-like helix-turn-helix DNA-binding protein [Lacticaseibacillus paracasei]
MSSEREVSKMFIRYIQDGLRNERIDRYRASRRLINTTPLEDWLLEEIREPYHLQDFTLTLEEIAELENFVDDERLSKAIATLSTADKMVLYQYYYDELNDVEIGSQVGITSQGANKRRRRALQRIKAAYENM